MGEHMIAPKILQEMSADALESKLIQVEATRNDATKRLAAAESVVRRAPMPPREAGARRRWRDQLSKSVQQSAAYRTQIQTARADRHAILILLGRHDELIRGIVDHDAVPWRGLFPYQRNVLIWAAEERLSRQNQDEVNCA